MNPKVKTYLAVAAGVVVGAAIIAIIEMLSPFQPPADINIDDKVQMGDYIHSLPMAAFIIILLAYFMAALVGGVVANYLTRDTKYRPAMVVAAGLCVFGIINFFMFPHPVWFMIVSSLIYFVGGWLATKIAVRR